MIDYPTTAYTRQTDRQTDGQLVSQSERHRQTDRRSVIQAGRQTDTPKVMAQAQLFWRERSFSAFIPNTNYIWAAKKSKH